jgi:hypothetical protein
VVLLSALNLENWFRLREKRCRGTGIPEHGRNQRPVPNRELVQEELFRNDTVHRGLIRLPDSRRNHTRKRG